MKKITIIIFILFTALCATAQINGVVKEIIDGAFSINEMVQYKADRQKILTQLHIIDSLNKKGVIVKKADFDTLRLFYIQMSEVYNGFADDLQTDLNSLKTLNSYTEKSLKIFFDNATVKYTKTIKEGFNIYTSQFYPKYQKIKLDIAYREEDKGAKRFPGIGSGNDKISSTADAVWKIGGYLLDKIKDKQIRKLFEKFDNGPVMEYINKTIAGTIRLPAWNYIVSNNYKPAGGNPNIEKPSTLDSAKITQLILNDNKNNTINSKFSAASGEIIFPLADGSGKYINFKLNTITQAGKGLKETKNINNELITFFTVNKYTNNIKFKININTQNYIYLLSYDEIKNVWEEFFPDLDSSFLNYYVPAANTDGDIAYSGKGLKQAKPTNRCDTGMLIIPTNGDNITIEGNAPSVKMVLLVAKRLLDKNEITILKNNLTKNVDVTSIIINTLAPQNVSVGNEAQKLITKNAAGNLQFLLTNTDKDFLPVQFVFNKI